MTYLATSGSLAGRTLGLLESALQGTGTLLLDNRLTASPAAFLASGSFAGGTFRLLWTADIGADGCVVGPCVVLNGLAASPAALVHYWHRTKEGMRLGGVMCHIPRRR